MNNAKKIIFGTMQIVIPAAISMSIVLYLRDLSIVWLGALIGMISMLLIDELFKKITDKETAWSYFNAKDKFVFTVCTIILLFFIFCPIKESMPVGVIFISSLLGYILDWVIIGFWGSDKLAGMFFGQRLKNEFYRYWHKNWVSAPKR
ncbi:MAG: hypothetical protein ACOYYJ_16785 [Chloroflexota bacterium]